MWFFRKSPRDAELEEELQAHLEIETRQFTDRGVPRERAELEARRLFGNRALILERTRETRGRAAFGGIGGDLRYAARVLRCEPAFAITAILSLALGIGAACAVFSIADTIFFRPLPYAHAGRLVWVAIRFPGMGGEFVPSPDYVAWRRDNRAFDNLAATQASLSNTGLLGGADPAEVKVARVSANFLDVFGVAPALGRSFTAAEELPNGPRAILLTDRFWREHFQARRDILGSTVALDGQPYAIAGVLPQSFVYPVDVKIDLLTTLPVSPAANHRDRSMSTWAVIGRLKSGVSLSEARVDADRLFAQSRADFPQMFRADNSMVVQSLREHRTGNSGALMLILIGAAGCLLAIACANVANLMLARWSSRSQELAVRAAIGAARGRLARQLFTEIALLIAAGTAVAMALTAVALGAFVHFAAGEIPRLAEVATDWRVFGIGLLIATATALVFGLLPVLRAGRTDLLSVLQTGRGGASGHAFLRRALVVTEVALSLILLSGAALLFQTLWRLRNDRLGFQPEHLLTVSIPLRGAIAADPARKALASDVETWLHRIPGTEAAAMSECTPLTGGATSTVFSRADRPLPEPFHRGDGIAVCGAEPDYIKAAGTRVVRGRFLTADDFLHPGTVVAINEAVARAYFPGENPIGKQILGAGGPWKTVVGVVADSKNQGLNHPAAPEVFLNDFWTDRRQLSFLVRTLAPEANFARALQDEVRADRRGLFTKIQTLDDAIGEMTAPPRFNTILLGSFAVVAFLMAIVGVYGVLAFSVTQRQREIGIRTALGAPPAAVLRLVMKEGAVMLVAGSVLGLGGALCLTRYLTALLYGVTPTDPVTFAAVLIGLALATAVASYLPARRAAALDPLVALRQ